MFIYNASLNLSLRAYGIEVPMLDQRTAHVRHWILNQIENGYFSLNAIVDKEFAQASEELLKLAHEEGFLRNCALNPDEEIIKTFELKDKDGNCHRYSPHEALKPLSNLMETSKRQVVASVFAAELAFERGFGFLLGGGLHHAMSFGGRGFCQFNDIVIAARQLQKAKNPGHIWIIDLDAHKGDGTAQILKDDASISTFSVHMAKGWPLDEDPLDENGKLRPWFIKSDVDVALEAGEESAYISKLEQGLKEMEACCPAADFVIIVQGSDPYKKDQLPGSSFLQLDLEQMLERDRLVYELFSKKNVPQLYLMSGGYGEFAHEPYLQFLESVKHDLKRL